MLGGHAYLRDSTKIIKFQEALGSAKVRADTLEDLWCLQRITFAGDIVRSESERKFRSTEGDEGELKKVFITLKVEKTELDKSAVRLRIMGKIVDGKPLEYVKLNSYHTINVAPGDTIELLKTTWPRYVQQVLRDAVSDSKRAMLGIIVVDEEKALPAYLLGYGVSFKNDIYSRLSKRMSPKDFAEHQAKYYSEILSMAESMNVDTVVIAGPGFAKDDIKAYGDQKEIIKKMKKKLIFSKTSNTERSGVYELIKSESVAKLLEKERIRKEFIVMERFLSGLASELSKYGIDKVEKAVEAGGTNLVIVNDSAIGDPKVQKILASAENMGIEILIFNSDDEVGAQLHAFKDIACMS